METKSKSAVMEIMGSLGDIFAPMDAEVLEKTKEWARGRKEALRAFYDSEEYNEIRHDSWRLCDRLCAIAGGKTWLRVFRGNSEAIINQFVAKNCAAIAESRNARIAAKLEKAGVSEVIESTYNRTNDGFDGIFRVATDKGTKTVKVQTVYAGGFNIQCLHLRVLVSVK